MITRRTLYPGQSGTKRWLKKYGDKLVCVRYKYDSTKKRKFITAEIIVDENMWEPDPKRIPANKLIDIKVDYGEVHIGKLVREAGGRWNRTKKVWELAYKNVIDLGLENRIVTK